MENIQQKILQEHLLKLLKEIDSICKKYDITYYAAGGTTIGAVRHNGFIPWDDDADLYMTRDNFYRFREAFYKENPKDRVLECLDDNKGCPSVIPRYIEETTTTLCRFHCLNTSAAGLIIDIFILDPFPNEKEKQEEYLAKFNVYNDLVLPFYVFSHRNNSEYIDMYFEYEEKVKEFGREAVMQELEEELFVYDENECDSYILRWGSVPSVFPKDLFGKPEFFKFEDMELPVPEKWSDYLHQLYGADWMHIPVPSAAHQHTSIVNMDIPYTFYTEKMDKLINKELAQIRYDLRKRTKIVHTRSKMMLDEKLAVANAKYTLSVQEKILADNGIDVNQLFADKQYKQIIELFDTYLEAQLAHQYIGKLNHGGIARYKNPIYIELPDEYLYPVLYSLTAEGAHKKAERLLQVRETLEKPVSEGLENLKTLFKQIKRVTGLYYSGEFEKANEVFRLFSHADRELRVIKRIDMLLSAALAINEDHFNEAEDRIKAAMELFPNEIEFVKAYGDLLYKMGRENEAKELYRQVLANSRNGMLLLDINNKFEDLSFKKKYFDEEARLIGGTTDDEDESEDDDDDENLKLVPIQPLSEYQQVQLDLLKDIDRICKANDIKYCLQGRTAVYAYYKNQFENDLISNTVVMDTEDAMRFIEAVEAENAPNRALTSMLTDDRHLHYDMYYKAIDTLDYSLLRRDNDYNREIFVVIRIVRRNSKKKLTRYMIRAMEIIHEAPLIRLAVKAPRKERFKLKLGRTISKCLGVKGRAWLSRKLFTKITQVSLEATTKRAYLVESAKGFAYKKRKYKRFPKNRTITATLYGYEFPVFARIALPGNEPRDVVADKRNSFEKRGMYRFVSSKLSYAEIESIIAEDALDVYARKILPKIRRHNSRLKKRNKNVQKYWATVCMLEDQRLMQEKYSKHKNWILEALKNDEEENRDFDRFTREYIKLARYYMRFGLAFFFDIDIHYAFVEWLRLKERNILALRLHNRGEYEQYLLGEKSREDLLIEDHRFEKFEKYW